MGPWLNLMSLLALMCSSNLVSSSDPEVILAQGKAIGLWKYTVNGRKVSSFLNLPYAKPPIGELRFKNPEPAGPWEGILSANNDDPKMCYQSGGRSDFSSEDCLYLNVYTPQVSQGRNEKLLDVLVFIHGGGFQKGYAHLFGPEYLLDEEDVVIVTMNYRLGVLGFLSLQDDVIPGNFGLKDQLLALKWTKENIIKFRGDPNKITLVGHSAGGASVHLLMLSQQSRGLFQKAIALSGVALNPWVVSRSPKTKAIQIAEALNCSLSSSEEIAECLRTKPAQLVTDQALRFVKFVGYDWMAVNPVIEKSPHGFLTKTPIDIIRSGEAADVPFLLSYMGDDGLGFSAKIFTNRTASCQLEKNWDDWLPTILYYDVDDDHKNQVGQAIREFYLGCKRIVENPKGFTQMFTDTFLTLGIRETAKIHSLIYKSPVHAYVFSHVGGKRMSDMFNHSELYKGGAVHGDDLFYVLKYKKIEKRTGDPKEDAMSKLLISMWMDFIRGTPSREWEPVRSGLPAFGYLNVSGPDSSKNCYQKLNDSIVERFWKTLPLTQ